MKIERLLSIIIYLLNHKRVSAKTLADQYHVSKRTIQRDIDTLTLAGIPIISFSGFDGGYELMDDYKMHVQLANGNDYDLILTAVKGFSTFLKNDEIKTTLDKLESMNIGHNSPIILDFSVLQEKSIINEHLQQLEDYILKQNVIEFQYTDASGTISKRKVEPLAVIYQWYSWYLFAYDLDKQDYRYFKLIRMEKLNKIYGTNEHSNQDITKLMKEHSNGKNVECDHILIKCKQASIMKVIEYLNAKIIETYDNGECLMSMNLPRNESAWKATLLSLGSDIKIIEPQSLIEELNEYCKQFLSIYQ